VQNPVGNIDIESDFGRPQHAREGISTFNSVLRLKAFAAQQTGQNRLLLLILVWASIVAGRQPGTSARQAVPPQPSCPAGGEQHGE
jgi:hypothetical protein